MRQLDGLTATGVGYLRGGRWGAVRTGLAMLYAREAVVAGREGKVRRTGTLPRDAEPLERALFGALYGDTGPRELADQPRVREAVRNLRRDLVSRGLVRPRWLWFLPRRTFAGGRALRHLRARHAAPAGPGGTSPGKLGPVVALYGVPALVATVPLFAKRGGLLDGGRRSVVHGGGTPGSPSDSSGDL